MSDSPFSKRPRRGLFSSGNRRRDIKVIEELAIVTQVGLTMAASIGLCFWIGYKLDGWLGAHGFILVIFILIGIFGGGWTVYRQIQELGSPKKNNEGG